MATRQDARSLEPLGPKMESRVKRKSAVSRRFVARTTAQLAAWQSAPLDGLDLVGLLIDGVHLGDHCLIVALGIAADGQKHALGLWDGSTENATVCQGLLAHLQSRGLRTDRSLLVILDGSKALRKAVRATFGDAALVQRCQVHKMRNILEYLSDRDRPWAQAILRRAYQAAVAAAPDRDRRRHERQGTESSAGAELRLPAAARHRHGAGWRSRLRDQRLRPDHFGRVHRHQHRRGRLADLPGGHNPRALAVSPDNQRLYVVGNHQLFIVIDIASRSRVATVTHNQGGAFGVAASPDGSRVYVMATGSNRVVVLGTAPYAVITRGQLDGFYTRSDSLSVSPNGRFIYVPQREDLGPNEIPILPLTPPRVVILDTATGAVVTTAVDNRIPGTSGSRRTARQSMSPATSSQVSMHRLSPSTHASMGSTTVSRGFTTAFLSDSTRAYVAAERERLRD